MTEGFTFEPAVRVRVSLLVMIAGCSGSGKTRSSLALARGLAGGDDRKVAVIDTERGRAKHYAPAPGESQSAEKFAFAHGELTAPFTPERYMAAVDAADGAGFEVIVIDSVSHEWEGEGGLLDMHTALVEAAVAKSRADAEEKGWSFNEAAAADKASIGAWKVPKMRHKRFVSRLLQCRAHLILCFRADEKMRMDTVEETGKNGKVYKKTVITQSKDLPVAERWVPICERRMPYEMTLSVIVTPMTPGLPIPIKLQEQHRHAFPDGERLSEATGRALAAWAQGGATPLTPLQQGFNAAMQGVDALRKFWTGLSPADKHAVGGAAKIAEWKAIAEGSIDDIGFDSPAMGEPASGPVGAPDRAQLRAEAEAAARRGAVVFDVFLRRIGAAGAALLGEGEIGDLRRMAEEHDAFTDAGDGADDRRDAGADDIHD